MLRIGILGLGFMGRMHLRCWNASAGAEVVSVCDADPDIVSKTELAGGNIDGAQEKIDFTGIEIFSDFDEMLAKGNLDAVSITLPTHLHSMFSIKALKAGVNVLCEKPMALNAEQCREMIAAAEASGKILQIGHCIRFWPEYSKTKELIDSGEYGDVVAATFSRLGSQPGWAKDGWFADDQLSGGVALDLHIHDSDYVQYLFGMPVCVYSCGAKKGKSVSHIQTQYDYGDGKLVTAEGSWAMMPSFGFQMSFNIVMEKATIVYDCSREVPFKVCTGDGEVFSPDVVSGDGYFLEIEHFVKRINGHQVPEVITLQDSMNSIEIVRAEIESIENDAKVCLKR